MLTVEDLKKCNNIHKIPKSVHVNKGICFDHRLLEALDAPTDMDYTYDFDVYLPTYGINLQRNYVWESWQQNEFILSILLEKPLESVILIHHSENGTLDRNSTIYYVIDGKQRLMTEEEKDEFDKLMNLVEERCINAYGKGGYTLSFTELNDWLNAHHFDYRGLIPMCLALEEKNKID